LAYALINLKLSRVDFDWLTPKEFNKCIEVYHKNSESSIQRNYEYQRFSAWLQTPSNKTCQDYFRFPWEELKLAKVINGTSNAIPEIKPSA